MDFNLRSPLAQRVLLLSVSIFAFCFLGFVEQQWIMALIMLGLCVYQVKLLVEFLNFPPETISSAINSIYFDDLSYTFKTDSKEPTVQHLNRTLNEVIARARNSRGEKDSESLFFRNIISHVAIGLIVFRDDGKIEIFNSAARKLLKVNRPTNVQDLTDVSPELVNVFLKLKTGGRELVRLKLNEDLIQLSVYAIELTLKNENVKLISIQNIQSELEEKEMEAWQNLVRVLTHEIMNSVTPISSLAGIIEQELKSHAEEDGCPPLTKEQFQDIHLSLQTISKRSEGLTHFVKEFRNLTNIPQPKPTTIPVSTLLEEIAVLHKTELHQHNIQLQISVYPEDLTISADKSMIDQVLINLVKNAIQAFEDQPDKKIELRGSVSDKSRPQITVKDNGTGIDPEALEKIFIPFFTTKKNGSGIGLSLSRQIMRKHHGTLSVKSSPGKGTEFLLRF